MSSPLTSVIVSHCDCGSGPRIIELEAANKRSLPAYSPGSHINVHLPNGLVRPYSLCGWQSGPTSTYRLAVARAQDSRGGSSYIHDELHIGAQLSIETPKNNFPLDNKARAYLFVAGGVGITPITSMIDWCEANNAPWRLLYVCKSPATAAFYERFSKKIGREVEFYSTKSEAGRNLNFADLLRYRREDEQVYCCGPQGLMDAVASASEHWPRDAVHFENFKPAAATPGSDNEFTVVLTRSRKRLAVPKATTILDVLEQNGITPLSSCRMGLCGTCETRICAGEADHRDSFLTDDARARNETMLICVSRSIGDTLWLDL